MRLAEANDHTTEASVVIDAPPDQVYAFVTSYASWPSILSDVTYARVEGGEESDTSAAIAPLVGEEPSPQSTDALNSLASPNGFASGKLAPTPLNALGETIAAAEAHRMGLVSHVFPAGEFDAAVDAYVASFARLSRPVVRLAKRATAAPFRAWVLAHLDEAERMYLHDLMRLEDAHEGLAAFLEKREPRWSGR